jgi:hypothetical protein
MKSFQEASGERTEHRRPFVSAPLMQAQLGGELKSMFNSLTCGPVPDRLVELTEALEEAFRRGDLCAAQPRRQP